MNAILASARPHAFSTRFRPGSSPRSTPTCARSGRATALDEVLDELAKIREEVGLPPIASPIGQILGSQALLHVLSASRYQTVVDELRALIEGRYGSPPGPIDATVKRAVGSRRRAGGRGAASTSTRCAPRPKGSPRARRSCCCSRSSATRPSRCCSAIRGRASGDESLRAGGVDQARAGADPRDRADRPGDRGRGGDDRGGRACASRCAARPSSS